MGLFDRLFRKRKEYPRLDTSGNAAEQIASGRELLEPLVRKIHDHIELVPARDTVYVFIGKPPGTFGMVWFENGVKVNFKSLARDKGLSQRIIQILAARLGEAYQRHADSQRFVTTIAGKKILVTPSDSFAAEIKAIIHEATE